MHDAPIYRLRPQPGGPFCVPAAPNNREGPQAREPSKCLNGQSNGERLAKEALWLPATRGSKKDSDWATTPAVEAVCVPTHLVPPASWLPKQVHHFHFNPHLGELVCPHRQTEACVYVCRVSSVVSNSLWPCGLWPVACGLPGFSVRGVLQARILEYLIHTGCHTLLEHYISCCPSRQLPWAPGMPEPLQPKQLHHLHTWSSLGQTQVFQGSLRSKL